MRTPIKHLIYIVLVAQSCPTLCNSMDCSLPGSSVHGILQARILEWVAVPFSRGSSETRYQTRSVLHLLHWRAGSLPLAPPRKPKMPMLLLSRFSRVQLCATLWTVALHALLSMGFSIKECWSGLLCPSPGDLLNPGIKTASPASPIFQANSLPLSHLGSLYVHPLEL